MVHILREHPALGALALVMVAAGAACPEKSDPPPTSQAPPPASPAKAKAPPPEAFTEKAPGPRAVIVYTASVQGYVAPCGCTAEPLGGVARLAAALDEGTRKTSGQLLFIDAGDLLFEREGDNLPADACQAEARHELLLSTYARKGLIGTTLGPLDDVRGPEYRDALLAKHKVPTLGVNLPRALTSGAEHARSRVVHAGETPIGVTAFTVRSPEDVEKARAELEKEVKALLEKKVAAIAVLAQAKKSKAAQVVNGLRGVDVVIVGHEPGEAPVSPTRLGEDGPILVASGMQAQYLGVLELELEGREPGQPLALDDRQGEADRRAKVLDARIRQYEKQVNDLEAGARRDFIAGKLQAARAERDRVHVEAMKKAPPAAPYVTARAVPLSRGRAEEKQAAEGLARYEANIPQLVRSCEANIECEPAAEGQATYVGVETCFECHKPAVKFWQQQRVELPYVDEQGNEKVRLVGHSKAWKTLQDDNKHEDRTCVGCHSIGFNEPGGYCRVSEVDFRINVQCEACHGPGSNHVAAIGDAKQLVIQNVDETVCRRCHHVPHIPTTESFVFEEKLKHILGPGHGEKRLKALSAP